MLMTIEINTHCNKCNDQTTTPNVSLREAVALLMQSNRYHVCDDQCIILSYDVCPACQIKAVSKRPSKKLKLVE